MKLRLLSVSFFILSTVLVSAQLGGSYTYAFLKLPASPVVAALGGDAVARVDGDINQTYFNPAVLNPQHHNQVSFNTALYYSGINFGYLGYGRSYEDKGFSVGAGVQYITYGEFTRRDVNGTDQGKFSAGEYAINLMYSQQIYDRIRGGITLKLINSSLESYNSVGIGADIGAVYTDTSGRFSIGAVIQNIGGQLTSYGGIEREPIPLNIKIGIVRELENAPFRFYILAHNLQKFDIRYDDPTEERGLSAFADTATAGQEQSHLGDKIVRHFIVGTEVLLGDNIRLRIGYNHMRRQELKLSTRAGLTGFSFGAGIRISKFKLDYSLANYHLAGSSHQFSITSNLGDFIPSLN